MARSKKPDPYRCPNPNCSGGTGKKQYPLGGSRLQNIPAIARTVIEETSGTLQRCDQCGCVYTRDAGGDRIFGFLDNIDRREPWIPAPA